MLSPPKPNELDFKHSSKQVAFVTLCPPRLLKIFGFPLICAAMFTVLGGHWTLLQVVAWSQMVVAYSKADDSVSAGIIKTFSGKYPCGMCKRIAEEKQKEEQKPAIFKTDKTEGFITAARESIKAPAPSKFSYLASPDSLLPPRFDSPPTPVPIVA